MSLSTEVIKVIATGNNSASQYSFNYLLQAESDLIVKVLEISTGVSTTLTLATDYTVSGVGTKAITVTLVDDSQAWLTAGGNLSSDYKILIRNRPDLKQGFDFRNSGEFFPERHEDGFDRSRLIDQNLQEQSNRSLKLNEFSTEVLGELKDPVDGKFLKWDSNNNAIPEDVSFGEIVDKPNLVNTVNSQTGDVSLSLENLSNVEADSANVGDGLILNSVGEWVPSAGGAPVTSVNSKVGVVVLDKADIGLPDVDNTSDAAKPVSTAQQTALNLKANTADLGAVATSNDYNDLGNLPILFSGDYDDLTNKPEINPSSFIKINTTPYLVDYSQARSYSVGTGASVVRLSDSGGGTPPQFGTKLRFYRQEGFSSNFTITNSDSSVTYFTVEDFEQLDDADLSVGKYFEIEYVRRTIDNTGQWTNVGSTRGGDGGGAATFATDTFTGDGSETEFTLTVTPENKNLTTVHIDRGYQEQSSYTLTGNVITIDPAPLDGESIEVKTILTVPATLAGSGNITSNTFSGNGTETDFTLTIAPVSVNDLLVFVGAEQTGNFSLSGTTLSFTTAPPNGTDNIVVKIFGTTSIGVPSDNTVGTAKIVNGAVTPDKLSAPHGKFSFSGGTALTIPNLTATALEWDRTDFGNMTYDSSNPSRIQITEDGLYGFSSQMLFNSAQWDSSDYIQYLIKVNGSTVIQGQRSSLAGVLGNFGHAFNYTELELSTGDYLEFFIQHANDADPSVFDTGTEDIHRAYTFCTIRRVL